MNITIEKQNFTNQKDISLFICAIGFEERSTFIAKSLIESKTISQENTLCLYFLDNRDEISKQNYEIIKANNITPVDTVKENISELNNLISEKLDSLFQQFDNLKIHVDYSSMPRCWYANILLFLSTKLRKNDSLFFWYAHGNYTTDITHCTTAGADDFVIFSGKASIQPRNRSHILGLGYDTVKSDAIRTVVDPSTLIVCYTYPEDNVQILETIHNEHETILNSAAMSISLPIENFDFIIKRIKELVIDLSDKGDVILIPDGPKPLILACSIIPMLLKKTGVVCFHIKSHSTNFTPVNIKATGLISGFVIKQKINE
ncbi:hypothetical protein [Labilibaculum euxinus]|uniref:Uncharacterized protein n=1 Tax=Labilibaculum euxinus TaxID=2686357 RepID=A0A7M4D2X8_9BACT|nr:hypothetical protein [Labilibaculum euxinus]MUP37007.1 hypothetical protein [Labilibaculum euxinus]MVB06212.1 hypothetical protein [Labilibaculum euxinus]